MPDRQRNLKILFVVNSYREQIEISMYLMHSQLDVGVTKTIYVNTFSYGCVGVVRRPL